MSINLADSWAALLLGVVEGLTEFIPVSSTGHLIIVASFLDRNDATTDTFIVVIQLAAILAVCWHFRSRIFKILKTLHIKSTQAFIARLFVAFLPVAVVGLLLHRYIKEYLFSPLTVAVALIVGGIAIIVIERSKINEQVASMDDMSYREALWVGIAQILALFPGVSRSAATIMGGRLIGLSRVVATEFSFFLAMPVMFAAFSFDLYSNYESLDSDEALFIGLGMIAAFISAMIAVRWLLAYVATRDFRPFGWYRIIVGIIVATLTITVQ